MGCDWLILGISGHNWRQPTLVNKAKFRRRWPTSWLGSLGRSLEEFNQFHHHKSPINPSGLFVERFDLAIITFTSKFQIGLVDFTFQLSPTNPSCSWFNHIKNQHFWWLFSATVKGNCLALGTRWRPRLTWDFWPGLWWRKTWKNGWFPVFNGNFRPYFVGIFPYIGLKK